MLLTALNGSNTGLFSKLSQFRTMLPAFWPPYLSLQVHGKLEGAAVDQATLDELAGTLRPAVPLCATFGCPDRGVRPACLSSLDTRASQEH